MTVLAQIMKMIFYVTCLLYCYCDGLTIGSIRSKKYVQMGFEKYIPGYVATANTRNDINQVRPHFRETKDTHQDPTSKNIYYSSTLPGDKKCDDCFLGFKVSRREAYAVGGLDINFRGI